MLKKTWKFCAIALLIASSVPYCAALRCYICSYVSPSTDRACIDDPDSVVGKKFITCSKKYCIIQRQELINPAGVVNTFLRGCEDKPLALNKVIEDPTFKTYYRSCTTDLCNSGDGVSSASSASDPDAGAGDNMIVPGKNSKDSLWKPKQQFFMGAVTLIILFLTYARQ